MSLFSGRKSRNAAPGNQSNEPTDSVEKDGTLGPNHDGISKSQLRRATRTRQIFACLSAFFLVITVVFLVLVEIGNTKVGSVLSSIYFLRLDLSDIVPQTVPNSVLLNTIAQTLGLHDYYQFGLWNFCEGYVSEGITDCSPTQTLYWFNPVEILLNELLAGATIAIPTQVTTYLHILRVASNWMFGLFLTGACLSFVLIFILPLAVYSRWLTLFIMIFTLLNAIFIVVASVIGTAISVIFQHALESYQDLNISATIGKKMFVFMWVASIFAFLAWIIQLCLCCCCTGRRDVKKGRRRGSRKGYTKGTNGQTQYQEKSRHGFFGRK